MNSHDTKVIGSLLVQLKQTSSLKEGLLHSMRVCIFTTVSSRRAVASTPRARANATLPLAINVRTSVKPSAAT